MSNKTLPAYQALALDIKAMGIEVVFGLMSDDTALFVTTLDSIGVKFHGARHENTAVCMAEGFAAASGKLGIAIIGRGPATANAMHGATYAQRSGSRVLLIFGDQPTHTSTDDHGPDNKRFNASLAIQAAGFAPFIATSSHSARQALADAVAATEHGAVALLLPADVQLGLVDVEQTAPVDKPAVPPKPMAPRAAAVAAAGALLENSRRPLIIAGQGAFQAGAKEALIALADHLGAALATTMKAKDMFGGHPMDCGIVGSFSNAGGRRLIEQADSVLAFGASMNRRTTSNGASIPKDAPLIHVDSSRSNIGRYTYADVAMVGDARLAAQALMEALPPRTAAHKEFHAPAFRQWLDNWDLSNDFKPAHTPRTLDTRSAGLVLSNLLPKDRNVVYDAGNFLQVVPYISVPAPSHYKQAGDFASIGMGFGVAMGFARANLERTTLFVVGDGAFLMTLGELETVARENIPLVIVVLNDRAYGAETHFLAMRDMPVGMSLFPDVDFAPVAEAFGFQTATVRTMDELNALAPMLANPEGPILIDIKINGAIAAPFHHDGATQISTAV
ncbi:thiamine pyrophosphate-binding protein [Variovorax sp. J31P207]|uniref:thiamine pyrophosphate-binding protein n=1 Tax=Variovorax sp. J31P207 TaxID=3053510 RepID=UPI0025790BAB|nr:thiamine pyrophosphate-binding protein [Variovorax sp. J31P207]MDM0069996.1 thiamine pyrophosphate-binding protein [Variovorax sp. J31P207]